MPHFSLLLHKINILCMKAVFRSFTLALLLCNHLIIWSQSIEGTIKNQQGEAIPFASVYAPKLHKGTTANVEGGFKLQLGKGEHEVVFQYLGYESLTETIQLDNTDLQLEVVLQTRHYQLPEVIITSSGEDPAYYIMRKAIGMSHYYRNQLKSYRAQIYMRGTGVATKLPALMRRRLQREGIETGKYFVSENISEITYQKGESLQTKVLSMQSAGFQEEMGPMQFITVSLYDEVDGIISPLSRNAFLVYRFKLLGTFVDDGRTVNKIEVIPRRRGQDLYKGIIFIREGSWSLHSLDLVATQNMASINIRQVYHQIEPLVWLPVSHDYKIDFDGMGAEFTYHYMVSVNDYEVELNPNLDHAFYASLMDDDFLAYPPDSLAMQAGVQSKAAEPRQERTERQERVESLLAEADLTNREMRELNRLVRMEAREAQQNQSLEIKPPNTIIADSANQRDKTYWQKHRSIPLSANEEMSLEEYPSDSLASDTASEETGVISEILFGSSDREMGEKWILQHNGIAGLSSLNYNTVDGFQYIKKARFKRQGNLSKDLVIHAEATYAFARERLGGSLGLSYQHAPMRRASWQLKAGRESVDYNQETGIQPFLNSITSLFNEQNLRKLYEADYIKMHYKSDLANGLAFEMLGGMAERRPLPNHTDYSIARFFGKGYTANILPQMLRRPTLLQNHRAITIKAGLKYTKRHHYRIRNGRKQMAHSKFPTLGIVWHQGIGLRSGDAKFQHIEYSVNQNFSVPMVGQFSYVVKYGSFLQTSNIFFADFKHFNNNPLYLNAADKSDMFRGLRFYERSTDQTYVQAHLNYQHSRILLKRLPFLAESLIRESLFISSLFTEDGFPYFEFGYGINQLFLFFDVELVRAYLAGEHYYTGIRISIPMGESVVRF